MWFKYIAIYQKCNLTLKRAHLPVIIDREAREIMYLVASVRLSVCLSVGHHSHGWIVIMNFGLVIFDLVTDRRKAIHKSPPCIRTGVLNKSHSKSSNNTAQRPWELSFQKRDGQVTDTDFRIWICCPWNVQLYQKKKGRLQTHVQGVLYMLIR